MRNEPKAIQKRRHRIEQRVMVRVRGWQKTTYQKEDYDGNANEEEA